MLCSRDVIMLPSNTAAASAASSDSHDVNGGLCHTVITTDSELNGTGDSCYTPVNDPDSIALLAAMHEANRSLLLCFICCVLANTSTFIVSSCHMKCKH